MDWVDCLEYSFSYSAARSDYLDSVISIRKNPTRNTVKHGLLNIVLLVKNARLIDIFLSWIKVFNIHFEYKIWCTLLHRHAALFIQNMFYCSSVLYSDNIASLVWSNWVKFPIGKLTLNFSQRLPVLLMHVVLTEFTIIAIKSCSVCISSFHLW